MRKQYVQEEIRRILENRVDKDIKSMVLRKLNEGLLYSYSGYKFARFLRKVFNRLEDDSLCEPISVRGAFADVGNDAEFPVIDVEITPLVKKSDFMSSLKREMQSGFDLHGWFIGGTKDLGNGKIVISFEPKYPIEDKKIDDRTRKTIQKYKKFYHVSFEKNEKSIMENGLIPKVTNRRDFMYPERIYLFGREALAKVFADYHFSTPIGRKHMLDTTIVKVGDNGEIADLKFQTHIGKIVVFEVDLERLLADKKPIKLYHDSRSIDLDRPNEVSAAYFTYNQINPEYLSVKYRFDIEGEK